MVQFHCTKSTNAATQPLVTPNLPGDKEWVGVVAKHRHRWTIDVVQLTVKHLEAEQAHVWHSDGLHAMAVGEPLRLVHHLLVLVFRISVAGVRLLLLVVVVVGVGHAVLCQNWFTNYVR